MSEATALKIALEALLELKAHPYDGNENDAAHMQDIVFDALCEIRREAAIGEPSPVVREVLAGVKGL